MRRLAKLIGLVVVLAAMAAVAWLLLRSGDPTAFATASEWTSQILRDRTLPASLQALHKLISLHAVNISRAPPTVLPAMRYLAASLLRGALLSSSPDDRHDL